MTPDEKRYVAESTELHIQSMLPDVDRVAVYLTIVKERASKDVIETKFAVAKKLLVDAGHCVQGIKHLSAPSDEF